MVAQIIGGLEKGQVLEGTVKNITSYGVFVDLGGVDGLIHITDLAYGRVSHPEEIVKLDDKINVVSLDFDDEKRRIALGLKQLQPHPWDALSTDLNAGDKVKGKVMVITDYGAFVEVAPGVEGLLHVSEMSWSQHLRSPKDFLKEGQEVDCVILNIDREERTMSLGMKQLSTDPWADIEFKYPVRSKHKAKVRNFTHFGIFAELEEGVDGLIHISDLSWTKRIKHPSEFCNVGDEVEVQVLEVDKDNPRLSLGHKQVEQNPWEVFAGTFTEGSVHEGTITGRNGNNFIVLDAKIPAGPLAEKWTKYKSTIPLVAPNNKRRLDVIVVGSGLAGASAAASLGALGYNVKCFTFHDSPRRAHSIAAQGGINAAKNYANDGDSVYRLFYDTIKGGDYRSREANVYRLAEVSADIIDQCVAQGVPFAREYGGLLENRSFGGVQVSRTFYARGQTGQQLLIGAYQALSRQISIGAVTMYNRHEMLDVVIIDGKARGIIARNLITGQLERHDAHCVVLATGGYGNVFYPSTNAMGCNVTAAWRAVHRGALMANPCFTQIHRTCIPVSGDSQSKLTLMSESLRNDGRVWVPKSKDDVQAIRTGKKKPTDLPEEARDYFLERRYPAFGNLVPRDVASRAAKKACDEGYGVNSTGLAVYLDFSAAIQRYGKSKASLGRYK